MPFNIDSPSEQVAKHLKKLIYKGEWKGELPGTPTLAEQTGTDRKTITAAIKLLEKQGVLQSQGAGRRRKIILTNKQRGRGQKITFLAYEEMDRHLLYINKICHRLSDAGHSVTLSEKTFSGMKMDLQKVIRFVRANPSDIWIVMSASHEILTWFSKQPFPTMALFGRRRSVPIAGVGPDKTDAIVEMTEKLISLGHRRIVMMSREERHFPHLGLQERTFRETLDKNDILVGDYNLPKWKNNASGFKDCLERLFKVTPPTALILEESQFFTAALLQLSAWGLSVPKQVSLACNDADLIFSMSEPSNSCIDWPSAPVVNHIVRWVRNVSRGRHTNKQVDTPARFIEGGTIGPADDGLPTLSEILKG
jgi:DNA-binding LacI/PurR family transcriptional regulator